VITVVGRDGQLLRRIRRDDRGREIIIIDNSYRDPRGGGGFYVALAPPVVRIPYNRYIVDSEEASPELIYDTMMAPPWSGSNGVIRWTKSATARPCASACRASTSTPSTSNSDRGKSRPIRRRSCR